MKVLDLFCNAGGSAVGYHMAWPDAEIVGVDIIDQPRYPFAFVNADANTFPLDGFDFIHASTPCHDHTRSRTTGPEHGTAWMLAHTVERLSLLNVPWIVENVSDAKMPPAPCEFRLCGSSFGLDLRRHRKFVSNITIVAPPCDHAWQTPRFPSLNNRHRKEGVLSPVVGVHGHQQYPGDFENRCKAMGIDWMTLAELNQAIPPAYTEWIGNQITKGTA